MSIADKIEAGLAALERMGTTGIEIALTADDTLALFSETDASDPRFDTDSDLSFRGYPIRRLDGGVVRSAIRGREGSRPVSLAL